MPVRAGRVVMDRPLSKYEKEVNKYIPDAIKYADEVILRANPTYGKRIVYGSRQHGAVKLCEMSLDEREPYLSCAEDWNRVFHRRMRKLTVAAGIRKL